MEFRKNFVHRIGYWILPFFAHIARRIIFIPEILLRLHKRIGVAVIQLKIKT